MPRPTALLLLAAAVAAMAPARAADLPIGAIAAAYETGLSAGCGGVLYPPSAELEAAATACWKAIDAAADAPPTECPSDECRAFADGMGSQCWQEFHVVTNALRAALAAALEGGKALPAAEVAKMQNVSDFLTAKDPAANPRSNLAAELKAGNATTAAAYAAAQRKEAAYAAALEAACRPDFAPAPPAAPAPAADAGGAPTYAEVVAEIYKDELPACKGVFFPASAEFKAAQRSCAGGAWWLIPTECPAKGSVCAAAAPFWGADCLAEFNQNLANVLSAASAALTGGPAMPADDVAKFQAWRDALTRFAPAFFPPVDFAALLESGDIAFASVREKSMKIHTALTTVCASAAGAGPAPVPAPAAAGGPAAAAAAAASGARAPAAAAAAVLLAALAI
jgi:hypothetical protein